MGPPFGEFGPGMKLDYGLAKAALTYEPPVTDPTVVEAAEPGTYTLPHLGQLTRQRSNWRWIRQPATERSRTRQVRWSERPRQR